MRLVGLDVGHRNVNAFDGNQDIVFSALALPVGSAPSHLSGAVAGQIITVDGEQFVAGLDPDSVPNWSPMYGDKFIQSKAWKALALRAISQFTHERMALAVGLPSDLYENDELVALVKRLLTDKHKVGGRTIEVSLVVVIEQPCGSARAFLETEDGKRLAGSILCVADAGGGTFDARLVMNDQAFPDVGGSTRPCMNALCESLVGRVAARIGANSVGAGRIEAAMRSKGMLSHFGKEVDISDIIKEGAQETADRLAVWLDGLLQGSEAEGVLLTGGGADVLFEPLKNRIDNIVKMVDPMKANARGFQKILSDIVASQAPTSPKVVPMDEAKRSG
ncbi:MAG: hypothetical protein ACR2RF_33385 [Geminicoccaceae bacterium]